MSKIVVIGAGYAGMYGLMRLTARLKGDEIILVNASDTFVERIRQHQIVTNGYPVRYPLHKLLGKRRVNLVVGWVDHLDLNNRRVCVQTAEGVQHIAYDNLLYTAGSTIDRDSIPGVREYAYTLTPLGERSVSELRGLLPQLAANGGHLAVAGGGLTGIESATEFADRYPGLRITLVTRGMFGERLSQKAQAYLRQTFAQLGIEVIEQTNIERINHDHLVLDGGKTLSWDVCLWAGAFAVPGLAAKSGLMVDSKGRVMVDAYLRSLSHPEVYAAGDSAAIIDGACPPMRMACATACPMGIQAAENIIALRHGKAQKPFTFNYILQCISLGRGQGLVQVVRADDTPVERIITGRFGAWVKEFICWGTIAALKAERMLPGIYRWPGQNQHPDAAHHQTAEFAV